jgi:CBS domain-containing protein
MKVDRIMEKEVVTCGPEDSLDSIALLMWNHDCGAVPIVGSDRHPLGMITDRDIAMATALQHKPLWQIRAQEVSNGRKVVTCSSGASAEDAMRKMGEHGVRRLPVVDGDGRIQGLLSLDDAVLHSGLGKSGDSSSLPYEEVISALKEVCQQQCRH